MCSRYTISENLEARRRFRMSCFDDGERSISGAETGGGTGVPTTGVPVLHHFHAEPGRISTRRGPGRALTVCLTWVSGSLVCGKLLWSRRERCAPERDLFMGKKKAAKKGKKHAKKTGQKTRRAAREKSERDQSWVQDEVRRIDDLFKQARLTEYDFEREWKGNPKASNPSLRLRVYIGELVNLFRYPKECGSNAVGRLAELLGGRHSKRNLQAHARFADLLCIEDLVRDGRSWHWVLKNMRALSGKRPRKRMVGIEHLEQKS